MLNDDDVPEWMWPYTDNYTGPYWSDGKFQTSVADGKTKPKSKLDRISQRHDMAYAKSRGRSDLDRADLAYYEDTRHMSIVPRSIGSIVLYGNRFGRNALDLFSTEGGRSKENLNMSQNLRYETDPTERIFGVPTEKQRLRRAYDATERIRSSEEPQIVYGKNVTSIPDDPFQMQDNYTFKQEKENKNFNTNSRGEVDSEHQGGPSYNPYVTSRAEMQRKALHMNNRLDRFHVMLTGKPRRKKYKIHCQ